MIQVCDPPRVRPVRRFSAEEFCFLLRGEAGSLYRPRSEVPVSYTHLTLPTTPYV